MCQKLLIPGLWGCLYIFFPVLLHPPILSPQIEVPFSEICILQNFTTVQFHFVVNSCTKTCAFKLIISMAPTSLRQDVL